MFHIWQFNLVGTTNDVFKGFKSEQVQRIPTHTHLAVTGVVLNSFENVNRNAAFLSQH